MPASANYYAVLAPTGNAAPAAALPGPWGPLTLPTSTAGLAEAISALLAVGGGTLYIEPGTYTPIDWTALPPTITNIQFCGAPSTDGMAGSILKLTTGVVGTGSSFVNCIFENIAFTSPAPSSGTHIFYGPTSTNNVFRGVVFIDNVLHPISYHGPNLWVIRCRFIASAGAPAAIDQDIFSPAGPFVCEGSEWNYAPSTLSGHSGLLIGTDGSDTTAGPTGPWWILNNRFLDGAGTGYYVDTLIDVEPTNPVSGSPNVLRGLYIRGNIFYNGKLNVYQGDDIWITDNYHHITSVYPSSDKMGIPLVLALNKGATGNWSPIGSMHIERNHSVQDGNAAMYHPKAISILHSLVRELYIRDNWFVINGAATGSIPLQEPVAAISISSQGPSPAVLEQLVIEGNTIGCSGRVPATKRPAITVAGGSSSATAGTINRLRVVNNRLMGSGGITNQIDANPLTVNGAFQTFLQLGLSGWFTNILAAEIYDNNWEDSGGLTAAGITVAGTLSPASNFVAGSRNRIQASPMVLSAGTITSGSPYTNPYGNSILLGFYGGAGVSVLVYRGVPLAISQGVLEMAPQEVVAFNWTSAPTFYVLPA